MSALLPVAPVADAAPASSKPRCPARAGAASAHLAVAFTVIALAACGGASSPSPAPAGGSTAATPAPAPATQAALTITGFTPANGAAGTQVTVRGTALDTTTAAMLGSAAANFRIVSATELQLTVPAGAATGRIGLSGGGRAAQSSADFVVAVATPTPLPPPPPSPAPAPAVPTVTSITPTTVIAGSGRLTLAGTALDQVASARLASVTLPIAAQSATNLQLDVPAAAASGSVTLVDKAGTARTLSQAITVQPALAVMGLTPASVARGAVLTIDGRGLDRATSVRFGGAAVAAVATHVGTTSLTVVVPAAATTGVVTVLAGTTEQAMSSASLTVLDAVPAPAAPVRAAAVEFAQLLSQPAGDRYQRLAVGRETWVRAYVVSTTAGTASPAARAVGLNAAGQVLGTVALAGPATLPVLADGAALPDALRYNEAQTFNAELPLAWVQPGFRVRVEVGDAAAPLARSEAAPLVTSGGGMRLVLVPLVSGSNSPVLPAMADVVAELQRRLPLPGGDIAVRVRTPYALTSVTTGVTSSTEWSNVLAELERLRDAESPNDHYYGFVKPMVSAGVAGIGYVNSIGSRSPGLSSLGWDASRSTWPRTMIHELGHNLSRPHAPCGNVAGADAAYPYAGGLLGPTPLFDILANDILAPTGQADIMGYCGGNWFSDYNLDGVMRFLEARPQALKDVTATTGADVVGTSGTGGGSSASAPGDVLVVSGRVDASGGVNLAPLRVVRGGLRDTASAAGEGAYLLRLTTVDGRTVEQRFDVTPLDHVDGEGHFLLRVPSPGARIAKVEVFRGGVPVASRTAFKAAASAPSTAAGGSAAGAPGPWAEVSRDGDALVLRWNVEVSPHATLTLVVGVSRHVLALDATGGTWRIPAEAWRPLPAGGRFEVSLSDGADVTLLDVPRR